MGIYGPSYQAARLERLEFSGNRCEFCNRDGSEYRLECHHRGVEAYGLDAAGLLTMKHVVIVCLRCHDAITDHDRELRYALKSHAVKTHEPETRPRLDFQNSDIAIPVSEDRVTARVQTTR